ncbi:STAS domain-containing protein [Streptomyces sp. NPDC008238]
MSDDATDATPLIHRRTDGSSTLVTLGGAVDALTAPGVSAALDALTGAGRPDIVVDLRPVEFIDCSGLSALVRARRRAEERSGRVRLVCRDEFTLRTLRATRLTRCFTILRDWPEPTG